MSAHWRSLDVEIALTPMPSEYRNTWVRVLCHDCGAESDTLFHVVGLKCTAPAKGDAATEGGVGGSGSSSSDSSSGDGGAATAPAPTDDAAATPAPATDAAAAAATTTTTAPANAAPAAPPPSPLPAPAPRICGSYNTAKIGVAKETHAPIPIEEAPAAAPGTAAGGGYGGFATLEAFVQHLTGAIQGPGAQVPPGALALLQALQGAGPGGAAGGEDADAGEEEEGGEDDEMDDDEDGDEEEDDEDEEDGDDEFDEDDDGMDVDGGGLADFLSNLLDPAAAANAGAALAAMPPQLAAVMSQAMVALGLAVPGDGGAAAPVDAEDDTDGDKDQKEEDGDEHAAGTGGGADAGGGVSDNDAGGT
jgi:hypothetical protein